MNPTTMRRVVAATAGLLPLLVLGLSRGSALTAGAAPGPAAEAAPAVARPRLLVAPRDPFSGLPVLRARLAAGVKPPDDLAGSALVYVLTGDDAAARRALDLMRSTAPPKGNPSRIWKAWVEWSLAFDWLYGHPAFDAALKDRVAGELLAGAEHNLGLPSLADPSQASYHNHSLRELVLPAFALAAIEGHPSVEERARPLREKVRRAVPARLRTFDAHSAPAGYGPTASCSRSRAVRAA